MKMFQSVFRGRHHTRLQTFIWLFGGVVQQAGLRACVCVCHREGLDFNPRTDRTVTLGGIHSYE